MSTPFLLYRHNKSPFELQDVSRLIGSMSNVSIETLTSATAPPGEARYRCSLDEDSVLIRVATDGACITIARGGPAAKAFVVEFARLHGGPVYLWSVSDGVEVVVAGDESVAGLM